MKKIFSILYICVILESITFCESLYSIALNFSSATPTPKPQQKWNARRPFDISSTPLDIFSVNQQNVGRRSSNLDTVWKWDFWCQLQPKMGKCEKEEKTRREDPMPVPRSSFYYDTQLDSCLSFKYSGCNGNQNNFNSLVDCERHCKGSAFMSYKESTRSTYCGLQPNSGLCMDLNQRFYYDVNAGECKTFVFGGCGGNQNRFKTKAMCETHCKTSGA